MADAGRRRRWNRTRHSSLPLPRPVVTRKTSSHKNKTVTVTVTIYFPLAWSVRKGEGCRDGQTTFGMNLEQGKKTDEISDRGQSRECKN